MVSRTLLSRIARVFLVILSGSLGVLSAQSWTENVKVKRYDAGECQYVDLEIKSAGHKKILKGLKGEVVLAEKAKRIIVISTCPQESDEWLYFFTKDGKRVKRVRMNYGGIYGYEYSEPKQQLLIKFGKYNLSTRSMVETIDAFDMNGDRVK